MPQTSWTYPDEKGNKHIVGLYHGDKSGHFLLYCNARVIRVDFKVFDTKTYSFMLEDELCEVFVKKMPDNSFEYDFKINTEIENQPNDLRRKKTANNFKRTTYFFATIVLLAVGLTFALSYNRGQKEAEAFFGKNVIFHGPKYDTKYLDDKGEIAEATMSIVKNAQGRIQYDYTFMTKTYGAQSGYLITQDTALTSSYFSNGFPAESGSKFYVKYHPTDKDLYVISFMGPSGNTLLRYTELVIESEQQAFPEESVEAILCRAKVIYSQEGLKGLALLYHRKTSPSENPNYNGVLLQNMLKKKRIKDALAYKCK